MTGSEVLNNLSQDCEHRYSEHHINLEKLVTQLIERCLPAKDIQAINENLAHLTTSEKLDFLLTEQETLDGFTPAQTIAIIGAEAFFKSKVGA